MSIRTLAPAPKGPYAEVAVQADIQTTTEGLAELLAQVARYPLAIRVRKYSVSSGVYGALAVNRREVLTVALVVSGLTYAAGDVKAGGGER